jgi:hypothetical protein
LIVSLVEGETTGRSGKKVNDCVVADAVYVERVSATKFPANREINRENRKIEPDAATRSSLNAATTGFLGKFPVKTNRE